MHTALATLILLGSTAGDIPHRVPTTPWNARWGNHRATLQVDRAADAVVARIPWRRHDADPRARAVWVIDPRSGERVRDVVALEVNSEFGELVFRAATPGEYHVYFLPFTIRGGAFPTTVYDKPEATADPAWLRKHGLDVVSTRRETARALPRASVVSFEARTAFDRRGPMELIATASEVEKLLAEHSDAFLLFPEDRDLPIRMTDRIPARWARGGPGRTLHGRAMRNEFRVFQVGVWAAREALSDVDVTFGPLESRSGGDSIPASALRCFNTSGIDWRGRRMDKRVDVPKGTVQALWIGIDIERDTAPGSYDGTVTVRAAGQRPATVDVRLDVSDEVLEDRGDSELSRLSRLRWLDSTAGLDDTVTAPYTPLAVEGTTVACLGRDVTFGAHGLPTSIRVGDDEILAHPVAFEVETARGAVAWKASGSTVTKRTPTEVVIESRATGGPLSLRSRARMEFDGFIGVELALTSRKDVEIDDASLDIPLRPEFATYFMGMGRKGGLRPERWQWKWDPAKHQDAAWLGAVDGGVQLKLKGPNYRWPLVNIHYHRRPLLMPKAWHNDGKGGCDLVDAGAKGVTLHAYGGPRRLAAGETLRFDFALLVTPVKPLDYAAHWTHRYYHGGVPSPESVATESSARIINIHHGNHLNPFINYPFLTVDKISSYVEDAHERDLKVKLYYTIRELTNHVAELWALRSLGDEIYADGPGGGYAWLHEHLVHGYSPAWHHRFGDGTWCASISQTGLSRWHNYYVEGLGWLARNVGIDGLYLDEIGYDREILRRVRRVLDESRPGSLLDLHSWNHFNGRAGWANCLNLYLEHMPYLDSLWIGEARNYDEPPDHWLVEVSGIPFGLFSEMLQGGGNPWRGMLYGMTNRLPWCGNPRPIWKLWDEFGIQDAAMLGYWSPDCPVRTDRDDVLATVYRKKGASLVCIASWATEPVDCRLRVDWKALSLDPAKAALWAPAIKGLQEENLFRVDEAIPVAHRGGWMFIVDETPRRIESADER